jgi:hypothetical protein
MEWKGDGFVSRKIRCQSCYGLYDHMITRFALDLYWLYYGKIKIKIHPLKWNVCSLWTNKNALFKKKFYESDFGVQVGNFLGFIMHQLKMIKKKKHNHGSKPSS